MSEHVNIDIEVKDDGSVDLRINVPDRILPDIDSDVATKIAYLALADLPKYLHSYPHDVRIITHDAEVIPMIKELPEEQAEESSHLIVPV